MLKYYFGKGEHYISWDRVDGISFYEDKIVLVIKTHFSGEQVPPNITLSIENAHSIKKQIKERALAQHKGPFRTKSPVPVRREFRDDF